MSLADSIINVESGGDPNARNSRSSASGPGQFINGTWLAMIKQHRPDIAAGKSDDELLALKSDPSLSRDMTDDYAADNSKLLSRAGLPVTPGTEYLAHFAGPQGAIGILNADPSAPAASVLGSRFAKANPSLAGYTAGQLAAWADKKMGGASSPPSTRAPMSIAGPAADGKSAAPSPAPSQGSPQQAAQAAPAAASNPIASYEAISQLAAVPKLATILPARPNPLGVRLAPLSFAG